MDNKPLTPEQEVKFLESDEKILWRSKVAGNCRTFIIMFLLIILSLPLFAIVISFLGFTVYSVDSLIFRVVFIVLILFSFIKFLVWLTQFVDYIGFYITDRRLVFLEMASYASGLVRFIKPFYTDISDIEYLEFLKTADGGYSFYLIKSNFYKNIFGLKFPRFFKSYKRIYLDSEGLNLLLKILKEKSSKAIIKINQ